MKIELSDEQVQAVHRGKPVEIVDPQTKKTYIITARDDSACFGEEPLQVAPGIRRSQEAYWRDLPELLRKKKDHGRWVGYHLDERIGIARTKTELIREIERREIPRDDWFVGIILPYDLPPWEEEEIEIHPHHFDTDLPPEP